MGKGTSIPPPPGPSAAETDLYKQQSQNLQTITGLLQKSSAQNDQQQSLYNSLSGLYDASGNLDQTAVANLKAKNDAYQAQSDQISSLQNDRLLKALNGTLPVSEQTLQQKAQDFNTLKENLARKGNTITGAAPEGAVGNSSAAAANLGEFNRTYALLQDQERRGVLAQSQQGASPSSIPLGYAAGASQYSPASLIPGYQSAVQGYGLAAQPYADQRAANYQNTVQNAQISLQRQAGTNQLIGTGVGAGLTALVLCFDPETRVWMDGGVSKPIKDVELGDILKDGGRVTSVRYAETPPGTFYLYNGVKVTGYHAVRESDRWVRVKDSTHSQPVGGGGMIVSLGTDKHRLLIDGIEFADEFETDLFGHITLDESLAMLNKEAVNV